MLAAFGPCEAVCSAKNLALDAWKKAGVGIGCGYGYVAATLLHRLSRLSSYLGGCGNYRWQGLVG